MSRPFAAADRRDLLREYFEVRERLYDLAYRREEAEGKGAEREAEQTAVANRQAELWDRYEAGVPVVPLSRCPFTGTVVSHSIDTFGLDGPWWDYDAPIRPRESLPPTSFALAGAVKLAEPVEQFPFFCRPGPEVPYVVPRLLELPQVRAVVSSVQVGAHQAFPIFYHADPFPGLAERINTWGTAEYWFRDEENREVWDRVEDDPADFDFDLEPWVRAGKLLWIAPEDPRLILRSHARTCPYLALAGRRYPLYITEGMVLDSGEGWDRPEEGLPPEWLEMAKEGA